MKKITSLLIISFLLGNYFTAFASVDEDFEGSIEQGNKNYESLYGQKVGFLVEGTTTDGKIKRSPEGYLIDDFLKNDSVKNINSGFNGDYGNVRLETSSAANIASYFPSVFNWNVPYKIYELDGENIKEETGEKIYNTSEEENMCMYGFTRSIDDVNDITTKIDVYGVSENGEKLIGKDTYNSAILKQIENAAGGDNEKVNEFINAVEQNAILIENNGKHEIYNYSNYGGSIKQSIMGPNMDKYSVSAYLEKVQNDLSKFDSEIRFGELNGTETSDLGNGKVGNHVSIKGEKIGRASCRERVYAPV